MTIMMNIAVPNDKRADIILPNQTDNINKNANNSLADKKTDKSTDFASLITLLLGLSNSQQTENKNISQNINGKELKQETNLTSLGMAANSATQSEINSAFFNIDKLKQNEGEDIISALLDLLNILQQIGKSIENKEKVEPELIDRAVGAINILADKLNQIMPTPAGSVIKGASDIYLAINNNQPASLASLALLGINNLPKEGMGLQNIQKIKTITDDILGKLNQISVKLESSAPQLSAKLNNLIAQLGNSNIRGENNKFAQILDGQNKATSPQPSVMQNMKGQANLVQANINWQNNNLQPNSPGTNLAQNILPSDSSLNKAQITNIENARLDSINSTIQQGKNNIVNGQNMISSNLLQAKTDINITPEPVVVLQSNGQQAIMNGINILPKTISVPAQPNLQNLNLPYIAFEFARNLQNGASRFQIQLDPPEMGRIDVRLDLDKSNNLNARLSVERIETLDLLQRDARALERALAQAGIDSSKTNLEFTLKQNPFAGNENQYPDNNEFAGKQKETDIKSDAQETANSKTDSEIINLRPNAIIYHNSARQGGLNIIA